jgi:lysophospholipase L1-like esterase
MLRRSLVLGALLMVSLSGCAVSSAQDLRTVDARGPMPSAAASAPEAPARVVAVGDSVTEADSPDFDEGYTGRGSWAWTAEGSGIDVTGGWALYGATTEAMAAGVGPLEGDVLVVMAGTNDVLQQLPWERSAAAIEQIVKTADVAPVLLCTIVPLASDPAGAQLFNARLQLLAAEHGWELVDSAAPVRAADGTWLPGLSEDGIHPTEAAAAQIGFAVRQALLD